MGSRRDQGGQRTERGACLAVSDMDGRVAFTTYSKAITTFVLVSFCFASFTCSTRQFVRSITLLYTGLVAARRKCVHCPPGRVQNSNGSIYSKIHT